MTQIVSIVYKPIGQSSPADDYLRLDLEEANLIVGYGIEGDAKGGRADRQLIVMSYETLTNLRSLGFYTEPGQMGEQIVLHQLDVDGLPDGAQVQLGSEAVIEIVKTHTACEKFDRVQKKSRDSVQGLMGKVARVIVGGKIHIGDPVRVLKESVNSQ